MAYARFPALGVDLMFLLSRRARREKGNLPSRVSSLARSPENSRVSPLQRWYAGRLIFALISDWLKPSILKHATPSHSFLFKCRHLWSCMMWRKILINWKIWSKTFRLNSWPLNTVASWIWWHVQGTPAGRPLVRARMWCFEWSLRVI